ncbi:SpoIIE family protein phosphatase [Streptomyces sp. NPDC050988]|uniref:SpoIIE family protein phosphatase n=1 Tax=Streptomyces sp. NPDC050988 TaxID=3365637 RepID=UPI003791847D
MFTDGLVERREEDIDASLARPAALRLLRPEADIEPFLEQVLDRLDAHRAQDDVAVLAARICPRRARRRSEPDR